MNVALPVLAIALIFFVSARFFHSTPSSNAEDEQILHRIDGALAYVDIPELFEEATLIVEGTVSGNTDAFQIESVSGTVANFTDYHFDISTAIQGNLDDDINSVDIRVQGGTVGNYTEEYTGSPSFETGKDYLVFLYNRAEAALSIQQEIITMFSACVRVFFPKTAAGSISRRPVEHYQTTI